MTLHELPDLEQRRWTILHETRADDNGIFVLARCSCGTEREVLRSRIVRGQSRSCGCRRRQSPTNRFWRFVKVGDSGSCWEWQSTRNRRGYGKFWLNGRTDLAHRVSYQINKGPIPLGHLVRHTCDNPPCVNPSHLLTGTRIDNARDAIERDRYLRGTNNPTAKLTVEQVGEIRCCWAAGESQVSMANRFGVSRSAIQWILNGRSWVGMGETA